MHYFLCVQLERFYVGALKSRSSDIPGGPVCVMREKQVLDADETAGSKGVVRGMSERQARALLEKGVFLRWDEATYHKAQMEWLERCLPFTSVIEPADQHIAFFDLSLHPNPKDIALKLYKTLQHEARMGAAASKWLAALAAGMSPPGHLFDSAVDDPAGFLSSLPVEVLSPVDPAHRERLAFLGYRRVGEAAKLRLDVLKGQFGKEALFIRQAALGRIHQPVAAAFPPKSLSVELRFEGGTESSLALDEGLVKLAQDTAEKLVAQERQGSEVRMYLELESGKLLSAARKFGKAVRCRISALSAFRLMLLKDLDEPVTGIRFLLPNLQRAPRVQQELTGRTPTAHKQASADAALRSLRTVYGDKSVVAASDVEMARRVKVLKEWKEATGWA